MDTEKSRKSKRASSSRLFPFHATVPQLGATLVVSELQHRESLCTSCGFRTPRGALQLISSFAFNASWDIVGQTISFLMLVEARNMVIRFPISAGLSRSASLVWTPAAL
ncbi:uncharacterized protein TrAFT101_009682 [Trichoderma asperellum]|uniref:uncharacterized protein n=1 Tax=Trichoderma asperellum TaxID=101201 RepID=UPI00332EEF9C|nr:hypothetical protein TrAFT101_009682 [Trichoderma asperellum]